MNINVFSGLEAEFTQKIGLLFQEVGGFHDELENKTRHFVIKSDFETQLEERWGQVKEMLDADVETLREKGN